MQGKKVAPKKKMDLDTLAQLMVEGFEDVKNELRKEFHGEIHGLRGEFRTTLQQELEPIKEDIRAIRVELGYINRRLDVLEERAESNAGFAKEIDDLRARVAVLEKLLHKKASREKTKLPAKA